MWRMARLQVCRICRPALGWFCTPPSPRASGGSPSCTDPIPTTTCPPKPCPATPPSPVRRTQRISSSPPSLRCWPVFDQ
ncbi:hypothetical protein JZ751_007394 [Albula glossodonta]|uniref:Uncharacterized protein n=1 Tax=Albula glossodonta TaxID=121402 RepID=A0A8T2MMG7_9TELE|nr:hypothetical protein JZ751_007394 [Albula glossodonta]